MGLTGASQISKDPDVNPSTFLASANPALVKRNVMASFGKALLLPVTIVPKTMAYSFNAVTTGAFNAVVQIGAGIGTLAGTQTGPAGAKRLQNDLSAHAPQDDEEWGLATTVVADAASKRSSMASSINGSAPSIKGKSERFAKMQLLLSLDTALQLIQADRDCLKRVQTFAGYPGIYGRKVRDAIEEVFIILLQTMADKHITPAFKQ